MNKNILILFFSLVNVLACSDDIFHYDRVHHPNINYISPDNNENNIALNKSILISFDRDMDTETINSEAIVIKNQSAIIEGNIEQYGKRIVLFTPRTDLAMYSRYSVEVKNKIKCINGIPLKQDFITSFETGIDNDTIAPTINGKPYIENGKLYIKFSEELNPQSIKLSNSILNQTGNIEITDQDSNIINGSFNYQVADNCIVISTQGSFENSEKFYLIIKAGSDCIADLANNTFENEYSYILGTNNTVINDLSTDYYKIKITARGFQNKGNGPACFDGYSTVTGNSGVFEIANESEIELRKNNTRGIHRSKTFMYSARNVPSANIALYFRSDLLFYDLFEGWESIDNDSVTITLSVDQLISNESHDLSRILTVGAVGINFPVVWNFNVEVETIQASFFILAPSNDLTSSYCDKIINFKNWQGENWSAKIVENTVILAPAGDFSNSHSDTTFNYINSSGENWAARISNNTFVLAKDGDFTVSHTDTILNYKSWDTVNWTAEFKVE